MFCGRNAGQYPNVLRSVAVFYEEDNYVDDVELAAAVFYHLGEGRMAGKGRLLGTAGRSDALDGAGTARHYQYYPFINLTIITWRNRVRTWRKNISGSCVKAWNT